MEQCNDKQTITFETRPGLQFCASIRHCRASSSRALSTALLRHGILVLNYNMKNILKKPNKYSSGASGSRKRGLNARPPQPASVSRLESILDGQIKKKKKRKLEGGKSNIQNDGNRNTKLVRKEPNNRSNTMGRRLLSDENTTNQAIGGSSSNRWSHVNSNSRPKHQTKVINPFLQVHQGKLESKYTKPRDNETNGTKFAKAMKSFSGLPRTKSKKDRKKSKKNSHRQQMCKEEETVIPLDAVKACASETTITSTNVRPVRAPTDVATKLILSNETQVLPQEECNRNTASPSIENKEPNTVSSSTFRPKLGLRLGKKTTKSASSRRVTSSPSDFQRTLPVAATGLGSQDDENLVVLSSPGKADSSLTLDSFDKKDDSTMIANEGTATSIQSSLENIGALDDKDNRTVSLDYTKRSNASKEYKSKSKKNNINDNFVRLNMKNKAGACRGAKNKSSKYSKERRTWTFRGEASNNGGESSFNHAPMGSFANPTLNLDPPLSSMHSSLSNQSNEEVAEGRGGRFSRFKEPNNSKSNATSYVSKMSGLDPLDEFVDGTFHESMNKKQTSKSPTVAASAKAKIYGEAIVAEVPKCARHQRPCKLIKVKKATTGNKGREFYACSMPRGEQCDHFQWADDTVEVSFNFVRRKCEFQ